MRNSKNISIETQQATITWTIADLLSFGTLWRNIGEILIKIQLFPVRKMHL